MTDIDSRVEGAVGRLTLRRPEALNALSYPMLNVIDDALRRWETDDDIKMVVIDAEGDRAFCAGGDIAELYNRTKQGDLAYSRDFWRDEYRVNAHIARYPKPFIALMDGIVMGGGVGLSAHGSHRIVTERSMIAMPECGIGLIPDVGGTYILSRASGHLGEFLGLTGTRMGAGDAILAGFADFFVPAEQLPNLVQALIETPDPTRIDRFAETPPQGVLAAQLDEIDEVFSLDDMISIEAALGDGNSESWRGKAAKALARSCPLSMHTTLRMIRQARSLETIEQALAMEYRFSWRSLEDGDFLEGIRAAVIDKDRTPRWTKSKIADVGSADVDAMLASLNDDELTF